MTFKNHSKITATLLLVIVTQIYSSPQTDLLLQEGKKLFWSENYNKARQTFQEILNIDSTVAEAYYFLGYIICRLDNPGNDITSWKWEMAEAVSLNMEKVLQLQPVYKGEIVSLQPREKIMSEWSAVAMAYLYKGDIGKAKEAFEEAVKRGGIIPTHYDFMKNMLISCPKDAVLITAGDMDTFFPLYLQVMEGIRTDVTVLNIHLCQNSKFLEMITRENPWQKKPLKLPFDVKDLKNVQKTVAPYQKAFDFTISKPGCFSKNTLKLGVVPVSESRNDPQVLLGDLVFLNVLKESPDRPLCIASTVKYRRFNFRIYLDGKNIDPFQNLEKQGLIEILTLCPKSISEKINTNEKLLTTEFVYNKIPVTTDINNYEFCVDEILSAFIHTASLMEKNGQQERGRMLFKKLVELIPGIKYLNNEIQRDYILGLAGNVNQ